MFSTLKGNPPQARYIQQLMDRLAKKAGIEKKISPHTLRHTFATDLYRETKNVKQDCPKYYQQKCTAHLELYNALIEKSNRYVDVEAVHEERWYDMYTVNHRDRTTDENVRWLAENMRFVHHMDVLLEGGFVEALQEVFNEGQDPHTAMAEIEPVVQSLLDDFYD